MTLGARGQAAAAAYSAGLSGIPRVGPSGPSVATESAYPKGNPAIRRDIPDRIAVNERPVLPADPVITKEADAVLKPHRTILDTPTPQSDQVVSPVKTTLSRVSRRLYSRCIFGLKIPGRYYFITWTSSPQSPPIEKSWRALSNWLKRKRPGSTWCYCITSEGHGVIHMILRLGKREKRLDVKEVRAHWVRLHKANQIKIKHVPESMKNNLAAYLGDQRRKRKLGGEMAWQDGIVRWHWSKGWLPQGFTRAFGRVWVRLMDISPGEREKAVYDWINACHENENNIINGPFLKEEVLTWPKRDKIIIKPSPEYDRELKKSVHAMMADYVPADPDELEREDPVTRALWITRHEARYRVMGIT